jgi:ketosteroid isomerase-like protein
METKMRVVLVGLAVIGSMLAAPPGARAQRVRSDQEILVDLEKGWDAALRSRDVKFIQGVLADEFLATRAEGVRADKAKELMDAEEFDQQIDSSALDEFVVKVYHDAAVVWFTQHLVGPKNGQPVTVTFRYTDVWVQRDGRWQCVASHASKVIPD